MRLLKIGAITVPAMAGLEVTEVADPVASRARYRMADGKLKTREAWSGAWRVLIELRGLIPPGLTALDWPAGVQVAFTGERAITSASNVITLPSNRRADAGSEPAGRAQVGDQWVCTPVALVGDVATLTPVTGATAYQAVWFPLLTVYSDGPSLGYARDDDLPHAWRVEADTEGSA
jgi:hypothetical protein